MESSQLVYPFVADVYGRLSVWPSSATVFPSGLNSFAITAKQFHGLGQQLRAADGEEAVLLVLEQLDAQALRSDRDLDAILERLQRGNLLERLAEMFRRALEHFARLPHVVRVPPSA